MSLTAFGAPEKAEGAEQTLKHVLEQGVTLLNTATFYGQNLNEEIIGTAEGPYATRPKNLLPIQLPKLVVTMLD